MKSKVLVEPGRQVTSCLVLCATGFASDFIRSDTAWSRQVYVEQGDWA